MTQEALLLEYICGNVDSGSAYAIILFLGMGWIWILHLFNHKVTTWFSRSSESVRVRGDESGLRGLDTQSDEGVTSDSFSRSS